jgi:hypothetical protein
MPGHATVATAPRPVLTLQPSRDIENLCAFYRYQFPGLAGVLITTAVARLALAHPFLTIRNELSLVGAIGAISYETRQATELLLECSTLRGIGMHKILAALETIWAFHTNDALEFCFCAPDGDGTSSRHYGDIGFSPASVHDDSFPLEERHAILGVTVRHRMIMALRRADIDQPVDWLKSRFHSGRFLVASPGMPTFKLEDDSLRIPLFRSVAGMKSLSDAPAPRRDP